jgi:phosphoglycerol transferase MdoB-like AlkP superfamily enzyme
MKSKAAFQTNIHAVMLVRLLVVLLLFFLSRIFFFLFNFTYFSAAGFPALMKIFFFGLRFDISAVLIINAPYILFNIIPFKFRYKKGYQVILNIYFYLINIIGLASNFIDLIYFRFTLKRTTADIFQYLGVGGDFNKLIPQFLRDFWYVFLVWILFIAALVWLSNRVKVKAPGGKKGKGGAFGWYFVQTFLCLVIAALSVIGIRGGMQLRPITLITAGSYASAKNVPLLLNTPFSIAKTWHHETVRTVVYFKKEDDLNKIYTPVHKGMEGPFKNYNVMIIIMESFSREHIGIFNKDIENGTYRGFTPFFDSLIGKSLAYRAFANGKTSIQGIPATLSGIPSLMDESFIQSGFSADNYASLASLLKQKGYSSAFFHGGTNGTMGFDNYTHLTGFDHYYGRSEYHNEQDYDGKWGIRDEEFFQYTAKTINTFKKPFLAAIFSLSSHHPYYVPEQYRGMFRKGHLPIQESIMYADFSLKKFFETARKMPWFENTLFVLTADHTSEGYFPYYQTSAGQYAIPILFYKENSDLKGMPATVAQQTDIMPTVLGYLNYDKDFISFGTNLFDTAAPHFSIHYISGLYGLIKDGYLLEFDGNRTTGLFDLKSDPLQKHNLAGMKLPAQEGLETFIKAYIQQYNNRLVENRLSVN